VPSHRVPRALVDVLLQCAATGRAARSSCGGALSEHRCAARRVAVKARARRRAGLAGLAEARIGV